MDGDEVLEERALIQRIRDGLRGTLATEPLPPLPPRPDAPVNDSAAGLDAELSTMAASRDVADGPLPSYRKFIGPLVAAGYRVIVPDMIGFGLSEKPTIEQAHSLDGHIADLTVLR